jgi:hypothetical protein
VKILKSLIPTIVALTFAGSAHAQSYHYLRIAGSTAYRAATYAAIGHLLKPNYTYGYSGPTLNGSSQAIFTGVAKEGNYPIRIKVSFQGSIDGVADLVKNYTVGLVSSGATAYLGGGGWLVDNTPQSIKGTASVPAHYDPPTTPDATMSDSDQATTPFTYPALVNHFVGVLPLIWVHSPGSAISAIPSTITEGVKGNAYPFITGARPTVKVIGRDEDSGSRAIAFRFAGLNTYGTSPAIYQYQLNSSRIALWPALTEKVNGLPVVGFFPAGHSGYINGSTLASTLLTAPTEPTLAFIGYLGVSDANTVGAANFISYQYIPYNTENVEKGRYLLWSNEHLYFRSSLTGIPYAVANQIANQIRTSDAPAAGILYSSMAVHREVDNGPLLNGGRP